MPRNVTSYWLKSGRAVSKLPFTRKHVEVSTVGPVYRIIPLILCSHCSHLLPTNGTTWNELCKIQRPPLGAQQSVIGSLSGREELQFCSPLVEWVNRFYVQHDYPNPPLDVYVWETYNIYSYLREAVCVVLSGPGKLTPGLVLCQLFSTLSLVWTLCIKWRMISISQMAPKMKRENEEQSFSEPVDLSKCPCRGVGGGTLDGRTHTHTEGLLRKRQDFRIRALRLCLSLKTVTQASC